MSSNDPSDPVRRRNVRVALVAGAGFFVMLGGAYASVPLYRLFCQLTGLDGTVRRADAAPGQVLEKTVTVRFDANVRDVPWKFTAEQTSQQVKIGETKIAFFKVTNTSDKPVTARATYNVVPEQAGAYFQKLQCFCFTDQTIPAGATVEMPVLYFIDPEYASDINTRGKTDVTLSYTFFQTEAQQAAAEPPKRDKAS
ncbi:cytochrome c oxidase assembly protein [Phenylobacterium kunshanense]|uniref:Cytochrome c oxidase assembly protein CtaG n=1 Tax=Phenylobacterium kunshanense TaxID=1445034 RepID=A0A328BAG1_9CAUL|nr:cytochrome c oxidase assembly protein [Phenylobacterium kunshanense]RAK64312.1 cytochrome c oxidase assembly protein [Phenylobacterium kunshanense]